MLTMKPFKADPLLPRAADGDIDWNANALDLGIPTCKRMLVAVLEAAEYEGDIDWHGTPWIARAFDPVAKTMITWMLATIEIGWKDAVECIVTVPLDEDATISEIMDEAIEQLERTLEYVQTLNGHVYTGVSVGAASERLANLTTKDIEPKAPILHGLDALKTQAPKNEDLDKELDKILGFDSIEDLFDSFDKKP